MKPPDLFDRLTRRIIADDKLDRDLAQRIVDQAPAFPPVTMPRSRPRGRRVYPLPGTAVLRQLRVIYDEQRRPIEASVLIKGGHLYEISCQQDIETP